MAEVTGLRNNALPYPVYGEPYGIVFPILDADGDLVANATGLDSEVSKNGDDFADCTNEATQIATDSGVYYLLLTGTEMTADVVATITKTSSTGGKTTTCVLYPRKLVTLASGTAQGGDTGYITLAASSVLFNGQYDGCLCVATIDGNVEARILQVCTASNQQCTVTPAWNVAPDSDDTYTIYLPEGMRYPTANIKAISDDVTAADNLESACDNYSVTRGLAGTALPAAAADAAGGLPISDAGGLDLDAKIGALTFTVAGDVDVNVQSIAGSAVSTSTAQLGVNVVSLSNNAITANAINADAITEAKIADNAIAAEHLAAGAIDFATFAADCKTGTGLKANVESISANAITATAINADAITSAKIADGAIDAATFAAGAITATVIADNAIDFATFAADCKTGSALKANVETVTNGAITAAAIATGAIDADALAADAVDEILDEVVEGAVTFRQAIRLMLSVLTGVCSGGGTATVTFRDIGDSKDRIIATVDSNGNRTAVGTRDGS